MKILKWILIIFGIFAIFTILLIGGIGAWFYFGHPFGLDVRSVIDMAVTGEVESSYDHPLLNTQQEVLLEAAGVDLETVPTEVTSEQQECLIGIVGLERAQEIMAGDMPTTSEIIQGTACLQ